MARLGIYMRDHTHERLQRITADHDTTQSELLSAVVSIMSKKELDDMLARYRELEAIEDELQSHAKNQLLELVRGKTPSELRQILKAAKEAG